MPASQAIDRFWFRRGHLNYDQRDFLVAFLTDARPRYCLETGFASGRSAITVLVAAEPLLLVSVDANLDYIEGARDHAKVMRQAFPALDIVEGRSDAVLTPAFMQARFPEGVDFAWIDGAHSYEGCTADLAAVAPRLSSRPGVIMVDDYRSGPPNGVSAPSVTKAVDDFASGNGFRVDCWNCKGKGIAVVSQF